MLFELLAAVIPLQWNATYPTDVPYECEFAPTRLGLAAASGFVVKADGKSLLTQRFRGSADGTTTLRFRVPAGTRALACETVDAASSAVDSMAVDNLFAGALAKGATWTCDGVRQTEIPGGHRFAATAAGTKVASWAVELPPRAAQPLPVRFELDVKSVASMTWGAKMVVAQFDAAGRELPEYVTDGRWTTEMLPPQKAVAFRERGLVHPQTRRIVFRIEMLARDRTVDEFGLPRQPGSDAYPQLELTHLALRPAAELPFPLAATIVKAGDRADYDFRPLPAGDYMLLSVVRFASHPQDLLGTAVAAELDAEPSRVAHAAAAVNPLANYYKAHYGQKGGRANWKWDFALDPKTFRPFWGPQRFTAKKPLSRVTFTAPTRPPEGGAEIAAVLVLPFPADEFRCRLEKVLCGLNACPERVR